MGNTQYKFQCCAHKETSTVNYQCSRFTQFISPCCMHGINEVRDTCSEILVYWYVLYYNGAQLALLLAITMDSLLSNTIMTVVGLLCLFVYVFGKESVFLNRHFIAYFFVCLLLVAYIVAKVIVAIVPSYCCSFWTVFLGLFAIVDVYPNIYERSIRVRVIKDELKRVQDCDVCRNKSKDNDYCPHKQH